MGDNSIRRVAVYGATRNIYGNMVTAAKSLLEHTRMDRVVFLTEDDVFPEQLPDIIDCINVSGQRYFSPNGPNYHRKWTYMSMMRLVLHRILPEESRVLWLDCDTIVMRDVAQLLEMDMQCKCFAAVEEPRKSDDRYIYHNAGVLLMDLKRIDREIGSNLIHVADVAEMMFPDQDAINQKCQGKILTIGPEWNASNYTAMPDDPAIYHFAAINDYAEKPLFKEYAEHRWKVKK